MSNLKFSVRSSLFLGAATAAALSLSPSFAQQQAETVVVTGSRIPQAGLTSSSPVTVVSQQEIKLEGATDVGTLLNSLPSVYAGQTSGGGNGSSGTTTIDLRNLGPARTLVLVDGKRLGAGDPEVPYPDVNQIPAALIDRTDVLTGGASAVYGSDAVAGVVNFIMRRDFEGIEVDAQMSAYQHDNTNKKMRGLVTDAGYSTAPDSVFDGAAYDFNIVMGTNTANNKGNVTAYFGYQRQNQVLQKSRDISACSVSNGYSSDPTVYDYVVCAGSSNYSRYKSSNGPSTKNYFMGANGALTPLVGGSAQTFNYGAFNSLLRPQTRWTAGAFAHYEVNKALDVYADFMFMDNNNSWQAAPTGIFTSNGTFNVSCNNPLLTAGFISTFCPGGVASANTATMTIGRRNVEGGPRVTTFDHTSYRMVLGAKGELVDGWSYDVSAQESKTLYQQFYFKDWSKTAVQNSLLYDPATGTCVSGTCLDIFHGIGSITQPMENAVYTHLQRSGYTEEQVLSASLTGDLGQYGVKTPWTSNGVGISLGAEYRKDILEETTSMADQQGDGLGSGGKSLGQPKSVVSDWEIFGETQIPVISNVEYIQSLSLNAGFRYASYNTSGAKAVRSYKGGAEWQPIDDFRFRASYQRAVRAANILELYKAQNVQLGTFSDPCANDPGKTPQGSLAGCMASGMTAAQYGNTDQCVSNQCEYQTGGNAALKPEESDTRSIGIVFQPTILPGFQATIDYYNIAVKGYIGIISPDVTLAGCVNQTNPGLCQYIHRDATGSLATENGYVVSTNTNTGYLREGGIDVRLDYLTDTSSLGLGDNGSLAFNLTGTWVDKYLVQPYTGASQKGSDGKTYTDFDCTGMYGSTCGVPTPSWRHKFRTTWSSPWDLQFSVQWRHTSSAHFEGNSLNPFLNKGITFLPAAGGHIGSYDYIDLAGTYDFNTHIVLNFGVNNVFDRDPPLTPTGGIATAPTLQGNGNTFNGVYDSLGRYLFLGITLKS